MTITATAGKACVIGWPVSHSRSPFIHRYWLDRYKIDGAYERKAIAPHELEKFFKHFLQAGYVGCNVTVPHKEAVFSLVLIEDEVTRRIRAVNTVYVEDGRLVGLNTDGYGFMANLRSVVPTWVPTGAQVLIMGAGGAARSIVAALLDAGVGRVLLANRTLSRASAVAGHFGARVEAIVWPDMALHLPRTDLLVNTTSLGMSGQPPLELALDMLPVHCPVADIVYVPVETDLLKRARIAGHPTVDGLGMLLHQAVPGFERWFGVRPEVTAELRRLVEADIVGKRG